MNYEQIIRMIDQECKRRKISAYKLAQMSSLPVSTIYGIFHQNNKAQLDTLCAILHALNLELILMPLNHNHNSINVKKDKIIAMLEELSDEKRELIYKLIEWLNV